MACPPDTSPPRRSWWVELGLPLVLLGVGLAVTHALDLDHAITDRFYDPATQSFPWRHALLTDRLMHRGVRDAAVLAGGSLLAFAVCGRRWLSAPKHQLVVMVSASLVLCTTSVATIKAVVNKHCPWSLTRYGGPFREDDPAQPLLSLWGHEGAFPAGHASAGFSLLILYFAGRRRSPRAGRLGLATGLVAGGVTGFGQVMRGAHFPSHNLWTGAICWYIAWGVDRATPPVPGP